MRRVVTAKRKGAEAMDENRELQQPETDGEFGRLFRTAFRGFNRQDVVECIARLTRDREREQENAQIRIRELEEARDQLSQDLADARKNSAELTAKLYQAQAQTEAAQAELSQVKADAEARVEEAVRDLSGQCAQKDARVQELERESSLSGQRFLAAQAQNALLAQRAQAAEHAAAQYAAAGDASAKVLSEMVNAQKPAETPPAEKTEKLASVLRRVERAASSDPAKAPPPAQAKTPSQPERSAAKPPVRPDEAKRTAPIEKKWMGALLSKLLNE